MILTTKNLTLNTECTCMSSHIAWLNDRELMKYSEQRYQEHTIDTQLQYIRSFNEITRFWWEISPHGWPAVGSINAFIDPYNETADVGILIGVMQMRGYGTEAWQAVCDWLLKERPIRKIEAGCMSVNEPMLKIFYKTGMQIEGRRNAHFLFENKPVDLIQAARFRW